MDDPPLAMHFCACCGGMAGRARGGKRSGRVHRDRHGTYRRRQGRLTRKASFPPVCDAATGVLILGSLPGEASLAAGRYYAHPRNLFWTLVGGAIGCDLASLAYDARLDVLRAAGIGLWDVVRSGRRAGSLDAALREVEGNDLAALVARLPQLAAIAFNGATAARIGRGLLAATGTLVMLDLPSSSPAYAAMPLAEKQARWLALRGHLPHLDGGNAQEIG